MIVDSLQYNATKWQPICINGKQVEVVTVFKLLGVGAIECLNMDGVQRVHYKESQPTIICLTKLKKSGIPSSDNVVVYCTVIRTMIEYASVVFANLSQTLKYDLERAQQRPLSIIYPSYSYTYALSLAGIQTLRARIKLVTNLLQISKQVTRCNLLSGESKRRNGLAEWHMAWKA